MQSTVVLDELIKSKRLSGRREIYLQSLKQYVARFIKSHPVLNDITHTDIEAWLAGVAGGYSRQTWLNRIQTLFSFAVRRGYIPLNPCTRIDRIRVDRNPPAILSPAQAGSLYKTCPVMCRPYLVLGLYAGLRPEEAMRCKWEDINFQTGTVKVDGKTRRRRIVRLERLPLFLLKAHGGGEGPIAPSHSTVRRWKRAARALLGGTWKADILRHSAASYLLCLHKDAGKVSTMLGNSAAILLTHYHEPVTDADCAAFWFRK